MPLDFTGFKTFEVATNIIDSLYKEKTIPIWDNRYAFYPNLYLELVDIQNPKHTCLGYVDATGSVICKLDSRVVSGVKPRNREQIFALDALIRPEITTVVLTGCAGTGKTILTLSVALEQMQNKVYEEVIITRPMSQVGKYALGTLPGDADEKFFPYLQNYLTNLKHFVKGQDPRHLMEQYRFRVVPLQLIRGASYINSLIIADEMQVCENTEILTLGTRVGEGSKLVIMGDLDQRDEKIAKEKTGIWYLFHNQVAKTSPLVASIELQRSERSPTARLFSKIFS